MKNTYSRNEVLEKYYQSLNKIYNSIKNKQIVTDLNKFTIENTVKIDDSDINSLFPLYIHLTNGVRDAIKELNNLNLGYELVLIYSYTRGEFYLLFKNLLSFIDSYKIKIE